MATEVELFEYQDIASRPSIRGYVDANGVAQLALGGAVAARLVTINGIQYLGDGAGNALPVKPASERAFLGWAFAAPPIPAIGTIAGAGVTISSAGPAMFNGELMWRVPVTAISASNNYFELTAPILGGASAVSASDVTVEFICDNIANCPAFSVYLGTDGFAKSVNYALYNQLTPATTSAWSLNGVLTAYQFNEPLLAAGKAGFSDEVGNQALTSAKVRVYVTNGTSMVFYLRSIIVGSNRKKARLAIVGDDGYKSFQNMGVPILEEFGFKSTVAIIRENVGTSGFASLEELQSYVAKGNECVAHGPSDGTGGAGNLWSTYTTNEQRIADINATRDYLTSNRLCSSLGARTYIWPQGRFCESTSDYSMLDVMAANGYTLGRTANQPTVVNYFKTNALSAGNRAALALPIIGHTWSSAPAEAANITAINTRVTALGTSRTDGTLMLHRIVGPDAAAQSTEISSNQLRAILANVKTEVDAGRMEVVLFSDFVR